jgi:sugar phosphate isomerase/epimerase
LPLSSRRPVAYMKLFLPSRLHVHVPFAQLEELLPVLLERRLQPEVAFKAADLDQLDEALLAQLAAPLANAGLAVTVHAPFLDLNPGAIDPLVFAVTARRYREALQAAARLGARLIIFHPGYDAWRYGQQQQQWFEQNLRFWPPLLELAARSGCAMTLENIFEPEPGLLSKLLHSLSSPWLGHCFDVGHWHLFADVSMGEWLTTFGEQLRHLHLHDNFGRKDDHLPMGEGSIDFRPLLDHLAAMPPEERPSATLEAHSREALLRALTAIAPLIG